MYAGEEGPEKTGKPRRRRTGLRRGTRRCSRHHLRWPPAERDLRPPMRVATGGLRQTKEYAPVARTPNQYARRARSAKLRSVGSGAGEALELHAVRHLARWRRRDRPRGVEVGVVHRGGE